MPPIFPWLRCAIELTFLNGEWSQCTEMKGWCEVLQLLHPVLLLLHLTPPIKPPSVPLMEPETFTVTVNSTLCVCCDQTQLWAKVLHICFIYLSEAILCESTKLLYVKRQLLSHAAEKISSIRCVYWDHFPLCPTPRFLLRCPPSPHFLLPLSSSLFSCHDMTHQQMMNWRNNQMRRLIKTQHPTILCLWICVCLCVCIS